MAVRRKGRQYQADFMVNGVRHRHSFKTEAEAEAWELSTRAALRLGKAVAAPATKSLGGRDAGTIGGVLRNATTLHWRLSGKGLGKQAEVAGVFVKFCGERMPAAEALSQENIDKFVAYLIEDRRSSSGTMNRYRSAVSVLAKQAGLPMPTWRRVPEGRGRQRFITEYEEQLILQTLQLWSMGRERDFIIFLLDTGARPYSEASQIEWRDIANRSVTLHGRDGKGTKNGDIRKVPLTTRALEAAQRWRHLGEPGPFTTITKSHMRRVWDRVKAHIPQLSDTVVYSCRHTCASRLVQRGIDIRRVQLWMGHKNITMTLRYSHLAPDHLMDAVAVLEGGAGRFRLVRENPPHALEADERRKGFLND